MKTTFLLTILFLCSFYTKAQLRVGDNAPEISLPDARDSVIKLSSLQGKVVLVDFWASWCGPCREANPYVEKLYKKYGNKGFEVYAVSIDVKKAQWLKAIKQDKLSYTLVIESTGWNAKTLERYFVDELPTNFLLDKTGKIVAINVEGKAMFEKVKSMLE